MFICVSVHNKLEFLVLIWLGIQFSLEMQGSIYLYFLVLYTWNICLLNDEKFEFLIWLIYVPKESLWLSCNFDI